MIEGEKSCTVCRELVRWDSTEHLWFCDCIAWTDQDYRHFGVDHWVDAPVIVCLCGSTRFSKAFQQANLQETLAGRIVLTIGADMKSDDDLFADKSPEELKAIKSRLDWLHFRKIDLADEVLILNVDGYIGESTRRELEYARSLGRRIRFWEGEA